MGLAQDASYLVSDYNLTWKPATGIPSGPRGTHDGMTALQPQGIHSLLTAWPMPKPCLSTPQNGIKIWLAQET